MRTVLRWPKGPSRTQHRILGLRLRWTEKSKCYRIERFPDDGDPVFIILVNDGDWRVIARRRNLKSAKSYCQNHLKQVQRKNRVGRS
jgi:hypothetical protein